MLPWTLLIGITYNVSALLVFYLFGPEFVAILGSLTGLVVAAITAKKGWLVPSSEWTDARQENFEVSQERSEMGLIKAWFPYIIVVILLLLTRIVPWVREFTQTAIDLLLGKIF